MEEKKVRNEKEKKWKNKKDNNEEIKNVDECKRKKGK